MNKKMGIVALGATISLTALAGCSATKSAGSVAGSLVLSPLAAVQAAFTKVSNDNSVKVTGTITSSGTTVQLSGTEQFSPVKVAMTMTTSGSATGALTIGEIYDGTNFYIQNAEFSALDGGKPWAEIDLNSLGGAGSSIESLLSGVKNESPTSALEPLLASGDLKNLGPATVGGVATTHYAGTLTGAQVESLAPTQGLSAAQVAQIKQLLQAGGVTSETIDVWIDSNNLLTQMKSSVVTASGTSTTSMQFSDWGAPVSIADPPANEVGTFTIPKG